MKKQFLGILLVLSLVFVFAPKAEASVWNDFSNGVRKMEQKVSVLQGRFAASIISVFNSLFGSNEKEVENIEGPVASSWVNVGNPDFTRGFCTSLSMALDSNNIPYVAYVDKANKYQVTVMKLSGDKWVNVGKAGFSSGTVYSPVIKLNSKNIPYVVYTSSIGSPNSAKINIMKFENGEWTKVAEQPSYVPSLYVDFEIASNDTPFISFQDGTTLNFGKMIIIKLDGKKWIEVGRSKVKAQAASPVPMVLDSKDSPYAAFYTALKISGSNPPQNKVVVFKLEGKELVPIGGEMLSGSSEGSLSLNLDVNNNLYITYMINGIDPKNYYSGPVVMSKFDGKEWVRVGDASYIKDMVKTVSSIIDNNGIPYVSFSDYTNNFKEAVVRLEDGKWVNVGSPGFSAGAVQEAVFEIDSKNVLYNGHLNFYGNQSNTNNGKMTVMKYDAYSGSGLGAFRIIYPNGGEYFDHEESFIATWDGSMFPSTDSLYFGLIQEGTNLYYSLTGDTKNDGQEEFQIPAQTEPGQYRLYMRKPYTATEDYSDSTFTVRQNY